MNSGVKILLVFYVVSLCKIGFARDVIYSTGFETELRRFNNYQNKSECKKTIPVCPSLLEKLIQDDFESRALIIESRAPICRASLNKSEALIDARTLQALYAKGRFNNLGNYSHAVIKSCVQTNQPDEQDKISKFYYYTSRLNQGAAKITQERILISKLLGTAPPACEAADTLAVANGVCEQAKNCANNLNLSQLVGQVEKDEELYSEILSQLRTFPQNCETNMACKSERAYWVTALMGLTSKNPWFLDADFKNTKSKKNTEFRVTQYLKKSDKTLSSIQDKIQSAAGCLHGQHFQSCDLNDIRETLSLTPELPEAYVKDKTENKLTAQMHVQACLEEAALDRNHTGKIMTDTYWNIGLTLGTFGLGAIGNSARLLSLGVQAKNAGALAEVANFSFDIYAVIDSVKETVNSCSTDKLNFKFNTLSENEVCKSGGSVLSASSRDESNCLISSGFAGVSALVAIPGGRRLFKLIENSGYLKASTLNRASLVKYNLKGIPNLPKNIKIDEFVKLDGTKAYNYSFAKKLPNGSWVRATQELPLDNISGAINANFPAGREFFEKIAQEKAGHAYMAFVDVGSLGAVNKTFKGGEASGDRYLKSVADKILENGEGKITLARLGGDEFGLIIDETDPAKVKLLLEKIQKEIRFDLKADAKKIFREEKIVRAQQYKLDAQKIKNQNNNGLTEADKAELRKSIDELAKIQQPDVSVGVTQIGHSEKLSFLLEKSEAQAKLMKTQTALKFGRSAEKYGSEAVPNSRPEPMFRAQIAEPANSANWRSVNEVESSPDLDTLREMQSTRKDVVKKLGATSVARYENEAGESSYRVEHYLTDPLSRERKLVTTEIPTRGATGLLDGTHPESQKLIMEHVQTVSDTVLVMPKLSSLKYLNYYERGTRAGDDMLEAVSDVLKRNMRSSDLNFKLNGADFLWSLDHVAVKDLDKIEKKINAELLQNPKVKQILENERIAINKKISEAEAVRNDKAIEKLKEKLKAIDNFKPDLNFRALSHDESKSAKGFQEILKKFDAKFKK